MAGERDLRASRRYATALFATAQKQNKLDAILRDLQTIGGLMQQTPKLEELWESKVVPTGRKRDVISQIFQPSADTLTLSFLRLLIDKRREDILGMVQMEMRQLADASRHLVRAEATFALTPTPEEQTNLVRSLEQRTGEHVDLTVHVDPSILGGVVVRMHDTIIDGSVRGTLERLREQLLQEA
jgi:F-type H+-transporting ATPase subunit delta